MIRTLLPQLATLSAVALTCMSPLVAFAIDGIEIGGEGGEAAASSSSSGAATGETYYEGLLGEQGLEAFLAAEPGLPTSVRISDSLATATYVVGSGGGSVEWRIEIRGVTRPHERVDSVYQMIAVLPLPINSQGRAAFRASQWGISPHEGNEAASVPLIYGGEKVTLKRNVTLEKTLLPNLISESGDPDSLPSLSGTGYAYTLWDAIVLYDPDFGDTVQLIADLRYRTDASVEPPDPSDERFKAYVITWIPDLDISVPPFAIRIDVDDVLYEED